MTINLGNAKLQSSTHTFVHFFEISNLTYQYQNILLQLNDFKNITNHKKFPIKQVNDYYKIINYNKELIEEKLAPFNTTQRNKRGLIDGLGSIIKQLTGNLDATDGKHIQNSLHIIKQNQENIVHQINNQYTINKEIMSKFNETVKNIKHNELLIESSLMKLDRRNKEITTVLDVLAAKDILNKIIHIFNVILNILQDIENSLTFCQNNIIHPSIITNTELLNELQKISKYYSTQLPFEISPNTIQFYKNIIKPICFIKGTEIIYTLSIPLFEQTIYNLYYFIPIPTIKFQITIPNIRYTLKSNSKLVALTDICEFINKQYLCTKRKQSFKNTTCEHEILTKNYYPSCTQLQLQPQKILEFIPEINQYLGAFNNPSELEKHCKQTWKKEKIQGIFLFHNNVECEYTIDGQLLMFNDSTKGHPLVIETLTPTSTEIQTGTPLPKLKLKTLNLGELNNNIQPIELIKEESSYNPWHLSGTVILYLIIFVAVTILILIRCRPKITTTKQGPSQPVNPLTVQV